MADFDANGRKGEPVPNRREFLRIAGLSALMSKAALSCATPSEPRDGIIVNDLHSKLNPTRVHRVVELDSLESARAALARARSEGRVVCIAGSRHAMGGQAFATDGMLLDIRKLDRVLSFDAERGRIEVESGIQWPALLRYLVDTQRGRSKPWAFAQKQTGADRLTLGGCLSANVHGRGLTLPPFIGDVESFRLLDARGELLNCSRSENAELFSLAIGGYGLFGLIHSVTLRLVPRRKLERVVEVRSVDGLAGAFAERIRDGFLYGDFQYAIDDRSDDFLRRGVFSCYRPVGDEAPVPASQKELGDADWKELLYLAHEGKSEAFERYSAYYLSTNGQVYWSDENQMSIYPDHYHEAIDRRRGSPHPATEAITEIYCERDALGDFMSAVRDRARRDHFEIIYGTVRLIEADRESFLAWAKKPYACVIFNLHVAHTESGIAHARESFRSLIDLGIAHGGSYYPTYHRFARRDQVEACYPQFPEFLKLKRKHDPGEHFQSDWYRHYKAMFAS
jgi:FAD/FMN-containing dehydrogenase